MKEKIIKIFHKSCYFEFLLDIPEIKKHTAELNAIGRNINIIARKVSQNIFYEQDIKELKNLMDEVWKTERKLLLHFQRVSKK